MSFNATTTLSGHLSSFQDAYADTDISALNWLDQMWVAWYIWIDNPVIATGLMSFLMHEVSARHITHLMILTRPDCILWTMHSVDYHRRDTLLPAMEAAADKGPDCG